MRIAIVDDDAQERRVLRARLEASDTEITEYSGGAEFLAAARQQPFQVVFLDIYMPGQDGMQTAKALRCFDPTCLLVFTTTSTDHALAGFQVRALHYLVKPYTSDDITRLMAEIRARLPKEERVLEVKVGGATVKLCCRDIVFAEHFAHNIHLHTAQGQVLVTRLSFGEFMTQVQGDARFFQCSRGVAANLEHARDFDGKVFRMDDGSNVGVSRDLAKNARQAFMDFLFQREGAV